MHKSAYKIAELSLTSHLRPDTLVVWWRIGIQLIWITCGAGNERHNRMRSWLNLKARACDVTIVSLKQHPPARTNRTERFSALRIIYSALGDR